MKIDGDVWNISIVYEENCDHPFSLLVGDYHAMFKNGKSLKKDLNEILDLVLEVSEGKPPSFIKKNKEPDTICDSCFDSAMGDDIKERLLDFDENCPICMEIYESTK